jgi:hypothetical protein
LTELSEKIVETRASRIVRTSRVTSPADACACAESAGMTVPITSMP